MSLIRTITRKPLLLEVIRDIPEEAIPDLWEMNLLNEYSESTLLTELLKRFKKTSDYFFYHYPFTASVQGSSITPEMHRQAELYMPLQEVETLFSRFFECVMKCPTDGFREPFIHALSWLHIPEAISASTTSPYLLTSKALECNEGRIRFISQWFIRNRHGERFSRYRDQEEWIRLWFEGRKKDAKVLDAACGTGEGVYDIVNLASKSGFRHHLQCVGESLTAAEILAAATGFIPHDNRRSSEYRQKRRSILDRFPEAEIHFSQRDITLPFKEETDKFDLILCNGLIGGPAINSEEAVNKLLELLLKRLDCNGTLLVDDSFHHGWEKRFSRKTLMQIIEAKGLKCTRIGNGLGCTRST